MHDELTPTAEPENMSGGGSLPADLSPEKLAFGRCSGTPKCHFRRPGMPAEQPAASPSWGSRRELSGGKAVGVKEGYVPTSNFRPGAATVLPLESTVAGPKRVDTAKVVDVSARSFSMTLSGGESSTKRSVISNVKAHRESPFCHHGEVNNSEEADTIVLFAPSVPPALL